MSVSTNGHVEITKGAMTVAAALKMIDDVPEPKSKGMVMHFRTATHGEVCPENCHPFPVSEKPELLYSLHAETDMTIAHNGVITRVSNYGTTVAKKGELPNKSDTQLFIRDYIAPMKELATTPAFQRLIQWATTSKFAIHTFETIYPIGEFSTHEGCLYSNDVYTAPAAYVATTTYNSGYTPNELELIRTMNQCSLCEGYTKTVYVPEQGITLCEDCSQYIKEQSNERFVQIMSALRSKTSSQWFGYGYD